MAIRRIRRREFVAMVGGAALSASALAQQPNRMRRIAVMMMYEKEDPAGQLRATAFQERLNSLGWSLGQNVQIDFYWGVGDLAWAKSTASNLLKQGPDVVVANGDPAARAMRPLTDKVPIVFIGSSDPVAQGFVQSLAHPGGNMTGFTVLETSVGPKWIGLLKEVAPQVTRVSVLFNPDNSGSVLMSAATVQGAAKFPVDAVAAPIRDPADVERIMATLGQQLGGGLIVPPDPRITGQRKLIISLAARYALPAAYALRAFTQDGGLLSYGISIPNLFQQAAVYADQILRGQSPANLPAQSPTKFELIINLKTAKSLGLTVPTALIATADEVIE